MGIVAREIDFAIMQSWKNYKKVDFNLNTRQFVEGFLDEYYNQIRNGLIDYNTPIKEREKLLRILLHTLKDIPCCKLFVDIKNLLDNICNERLMNILINDVFKLEINCKEEN